MSTKSLPDDPSEAPGHTDTDTDYGGWFQDELIVEVYDRRPPYPEELIRLLADLAGDAPHRTVLDIGCGTGELARRIAPLADRVDAVDRSAAMLARGRELPGGDNPNLRWRQGTAEDAELDPPYALITAGQSLHWMDWDIALPRFALAAAPNAVLAVVERSWDGPPAMSSQLGEIFSRLSPVREYRRRDVPGELERHGHFTKLGERVCGPEAWHPTVEEFIEARHSQAGGSRTHMGEATVAEFDRAVRDLLDDLVAAGDVRRVGDRLDLSVEGQVTWGRLHL
ncbi:Methyltransferase domain-containing protein [Actinopolymorpha cephalotaxi]|uniref:Methyltransferase domain-containing protein n=1 Tax=Actinopolymorpha cephalotaxi TaxID=504797 RepID=A0A1I2ZK97_9ACTN|nr:class I SAM-dependent methyltransferase [Actinopolymorpha cephalotaxi]NYH82047.1 SAM-dependent methyltransferase [Actinopolymorpha cephalotaxi]SFH38277.1 Methyltransferase domain-containing protein [Actinopolymorpha cephalotaxi]